MIQKTHCQSESVGVGVCNSPDSRFHQPTDWLTPPRECELNHNVTRSAAKGPRASFILPLPGPEGGLSGCTECQPESAHVPLVLMLLYVLARF